MRQSCDTAIKNNYNPLKTFYFNDRWVCVEIKYLSVKSANAHAYFIRNKSKEDVETFNKMASFGNKKDLARYTVIQSFW